MQDCDFLNSALEQAFRHPIIHSEHGLSMIDYTHLTDCFRFCDDYHNSLLPFALPLANVKKYSSLSGRAVNKGTTLVYTPNMKSINMTLPKILLYRLIMLKFLLIEKNLICRK